MKTSQKQQVFWTLCGAAWRFAVWRLRRRRSASWWSKTKHWDIFYLCNMSCVVVTSSSLHFTQSWFPSIILCPVRSCTSKTRLRPSLCRSQGGCKCVRNRTIMTRSSMSSILPSFTYTSLAELSNMNTGWDNHRRLIVSEQKMPRAAQQADVLLAPWPRGTAASRNVTYLKV